MYIPKMLLKRLYTYSSLKNISVGVEFSVKNRLSDASLTRVNRLRIDNQEISIDDFYITAQDGTRYKIKDITTENPLDFPLRKQIRFHINMDHINMDHLNPGIYTSESHFTADPLGELHFNIEDSITSKTEDIVRVPRAQYDDY